MDMKEEDRWLYQAEGVPYLDGNDLYSDIKELFLANGQPATLADFAKRYYCVPPVSWASKFPEYKEYKVPLVRPIDNKLIWAEKLIENGNFEPNIQAESRIQKIRQYVNEKQSKMLDEIEAFDHPYPTLNGYAIHPPFGQRSIILYAGTEIALTYLCVIIVRVINGEKSDKSDLISMAEFIGSSGTKGNIENISKLQEAGSLEHAKAICDYLEALPFRDAQIDWIVIHECMHHLHGHLEQIEKDIERCNKVNPFTQQHGRLDPKHYQLRRSLEFEADEKATKLVRDKIDRDNRLYCPAADMFLAFFSFVDKFLSTPYNAYSTHPPAAERLQKFREYSGVSLSGKNNKLNVWQRYLDETLANSS